MDQYLRRLNGDIATKEALRAFLDLCIDDMCLESAYKREDVKHFAEAKAAISRAFERLDIEYGVKPQPTKKENASR